MSRPLTGLRVLIAEDWWHIADVLSAMVEDAGGIVVGLASTVAEAEELFAAQPCDAALLDVNLHGEKVDPLAARLSEAGVKVVIISGERIDPELQAKVHAILVKPASATALIAALVRPPPDCDDRSSGMCS